MKTFSVTRPQSFMTPGPPSLKTLQTTLTTTHSYPRLTRLSLQTSMPRPSRSLPTLKLSIEPSRSRNESELMVRSPDRRKGKRVQERRSRRTEGDEIVMMASQAVRKSRGRDPGSPSRGVTGRRPGESLPLRRSMRRHCRPRNEDGVHWTGLWMQLSRSRMRSGSGREK
jgi:hypothetical protein